jgi:hypothetical protein
MLVLLLEVFCNFSEIYSFCTKEKNTEQLVPLQKIFVKHIIK